MKMYVAARFYEKDDVLRIYKLLKDAGHTITTDWTLHKNIKPYDQNPETAREYAIEDIIGVKDCDVFIFLTSLEVGSGSATELGAAILSNMLTHKPKIYVIGKFIGNNFAYFHPTVIIKKTIEEVLSEL